MTSDKMRTDVVVKLIEKLRVCRKTPIRKRDTLN